MEFLFLIIGLVLGFAIAFLFFKSKNNTVIDTSQQDAKIIELDKQNAVLKTQLENASKDFDRLEKEKEKLQVELNAEKEKSGKAESRIARAEEIFKSQEEKFSTLKSELENVHKKYTTEFENIANKILDEKSKKFTDQNKTNLDIILNPLKEKIKDFEEKVDKAYKAESTERTTLKAEIKNLIDLNKQVSEDANRSEEHT